MASVSKDGDKVVLPPLPPAPGYDTWRFQANAAILAATGSPSVVLVWLGDVQNAACPFSSLGNKGRRPRRTSSPSTPASCALWDADASYSVSSFRHTDGMRSDDGRRP